MKSLCENYEKYIDLIMRNRLGRPVYDSAFFMGIDTEYKQISDSQVKVLSYQIATFGESGANNIIEYIAYNQPRMSLSEVIKAGICSTDATPLHDFGSKYAGSKINVIGIAHYTAVELSLLRDRDEPYITKRLTQVQKSPVTDGHPIKLDIDGVEVHFHLFDSMLLAPPKYKSLDSLSSLLGDDNLRKIQVSPFYKRNMDFFLRDRPEDYEAYALLDSELCLKLFLLLQKSFNDLVYDKPVKLFKTISAAAVDGFLQENEWFSEYREGVINGLLS